MDESSDQSRLRNHTLDPTYRDDSRSSERTLLNMSDTELDEKTRVLDLEKDGAAEGTLASIVNKNVEVDPRARAKMLMWMAINTLATVFIVSRSSIDD